MPAFEYDSHDSDHVPPVRDIVVAFRRAPAPSRESALMEDPMAEPGIDVANLPQIAALMSLAVAAKERVPC